MGNHSGIIFILMIVSCGALAQSKVIYSESQGFEILSSIKVAQLAKEGINPLERAEAKASRLCLEHGMELDRIDYSSFNSSELFTVAQTKHYTTFILSSRGLSNKPIERKLQKFVTPSLAAAEKVKNGGTIGFLLSGLMGTATSFYLGMETDKGLTAFVATAGACMAFLCIVGIAKLFEEWLEPRDEVPDEQMSLLNKNIEEIYAMPILAVAIHCQESKIDN